MENVLNRVNECNLFEMVKNIISCEQWLKHPQAVGAAAVKPFFISLFFVYFCTCHSVFKIECCGRLGARRRGRRSSAG